MESELTSIAIISAYLLLATSFFGASSAVAAPLLLGVHPLDESYFASEVIKCKDGSKSFKRDRLNDDFCDCVDGTDEPGTSACPAGKFYCRNLGSTPRFIFSSHVNDRICDCCDGSDEYDGTIRCPNTCVMGGDIAYPSKGRVSIRKNIEHSTSTDLHNIYGNKGKNPLKLDDWLLKLKGMRMLMILQISFISCVVVLWLCQRRVRLRRRRYR